MENCLVTKLMGTVDDNNLPYRGAVVLDIPALETADYSKRTVQIRPTTGKTLHLKVIGGTFVDNQGESLGTEMDITDSVTVSTFIVSNTDCKVIVNDKYNINYIIDQNGNKTIKDVSFLGVNSSSITYIFTTNGDVTDLQGTFNSLDCAGGKGSLAKCTMNMIGSGNVCSIGTSVSVLPSFVNGCRGSINFNGNKNISVNTTTFTNCNFDNVRIRECICDGDVANLINSNLKLFDAINAQGLTGSVESCMEKMWSLGVRSRTNMQFSKSESITLNGATGNLDLKVDISNSGIVVKNYFSEDVLATYDGSTWTYPQE